MAYPQITKQLLSRLKQGDEHAFDSIYWKYNGWIYNFAHSLLQNNELSEDLTQTVFLKIWERRAEINVELNFEAYIFTIARNLVYKETENRLANHAFMQSLEKRMMNSHSSKEEEMDAALLYEHINRLVDKLPPARKQIYKLSREQHLSNKEIAAKLSISEKTVETQLYRSLLFLKKELSSDLGISILLLVSIC